MQYDTEEYTYIPAPGDMFDIVLGATSGGDMAEVQFFVDYLNLFTAQRSKVIPSIRMHSRLLQKTEHEKPPCSCAIVFDPSG